MARLTKRELQEILATREQARREEKERQAEQEREAELAAVPTDGRMQQTSKPAYESCPPGVHRQIVTRRCWVELRGGGRVLMEKCYRQTLHSVRYEDENTTEKRPPTLLSVSVCRHEGLTLAGSGWDRDCNVPVAERLLDEGSELPDLDDGGLSNDATDSSVV